MKLAANSARATESADLFNYAERLQELSRTDQDRFADGIDEASVGPTEGGGKRPAVAWAGEPRPR